MSSRARPENCRGRARGRRPAPTSASYVGRVRRITREMKAATPASARRPARTPAIRVPPRAGPPPRAEPRRRAPSSPLRSPGASSAARTASSPQEAITGRRNPRHSPKASAEAAPPPANWPDEPYRASRQTPGQVAELKLPLCSSCLLPWTCPQGHLPRDRMHRSLQPARTSAPDSEESSHDSHAARGSRAQRSSSRARTGSG